ncbi:serine hydrolase [Hymenobacter saemangeumensis]|uniref:serine hydrolase n=1 Tax=Hymenobacter saemangeumensis TaxID=1084522 RepID=UPI0031EAF758
MGLLCLQSLAQTGVAVPELAHCDESVQDFMRRWKVRGASVAISKDGQLVYNRAFGYADAAHSLPLQPYHLLRVASVSKPVTALAVMKLVETGQLHLSDKVFGPQGLLSGPAYTREIQDPRLYDITVQHLLEHSAGWDRSQGCDGHSTCDPIDFPTQVARVMRVPNPVGDSTLVRYMLRQGLNFAPGTRFAYSNVGYLVLGKVLEAVTHRPYEDWVREHVLLPSGILEARLGRSLPAQRGERESSYDSRYQMPSAFAPARRVPAADGGIHLEAMNAHGGWLFSARDLVRLALAADGLPSRPDLLAPATLRSMVQPSAVSTWYGLGWMVHGDTWWHSGLLDGTASLVTRAPSGYTWAILLNTGSGSAQFWRELQELGNSWIRDASSWPAHDLFAPEMNAGLLRASSSDSAFAQLSWVNGSGTGRLLLLRPDKAGTSFPLDGTSYPVGRELPDGTLVAANGPGSTALLARLDPQRSYYARVVEYRQDSSTAFRPIYTLDGNPQLVLTPEELAHSSPLTLYPNPALGEVHVAGTSRNLLYHLFTQQGGLVQKGELEPNKPLPVRDLPPGQYVLRIVREEREDLLRFVKE